MKEGGREEGGRKGGREKEGREGGRRAGGRREGERREEEGREGKTGDKLQWLTGVQRCSKKSAVCVSTYTLAVVDLNELSKSTTVCVPHCLCIAKRLQQRVGYRQQTKV